MTQTHGIRLSDAKKTLKAAVEFNLALQATGQGRDAQTLVPYLESPPGMGKTSITEQVAKSLKGPNGEEGRCEVIRLCDYEPSDLTGWVVADPKTTEGDIQMVKCKPDWIPEDDGVPTIIFFDEMPQGAVSCQNAAAQVINERRVGRFKLPPNAVIVGAGNNMTDRAGTNHMPTHLRDRMTFIHVSPNVDDTCNYFAEVGVDYRIIAYLRFNPQRLSQFDRNAQACPSPRSWERVSSWMATGLDGHLLQNAIGGQVGEAAAADFAAYLKLTSAVPDIDELLKKADTFDIPSDPAILFAVASAVGQRINKKDGEAAVTYLTRIKRREIASYAISDAWRRNNDIIHEVEAVRKWFLTEGKTIFMHSS